MGAERNKDRWGQVKSYVCMYAMYVCMSVCYVCMYHVCMYVCDVCMYVCMYVCMGWMRRGLPMSMGPLVVITSLFRH